MISNVKIHNIYMIKQVNKNRSTEDKTQNRSSVNKNIMNKFHN